MKVNYPGVLLMERTEIEAENVIAALRLGGFDPIFRRVASRDELTDAMAVGAWDFAIVNDDGFVRPDGADDQQAAALSPGAVLAAVGGDKSTTRVIAVADRYDIGRVRELIKIGVVDCIERANLSRLSGAVLREQYLVQGDGARNQTNRALSPDPSSKKEKDAERAEFLGRHGQGQKMEAIGTLAGGIAHDFNNILAAIMGFAHSALLDLDEESDAGRDILRVISSAERGAKLTSQILAFSRKDEAPAERIDFPEVVRSALELSKAATPTNVVFKAELGAGDAAVIADGTQWQQVILNLCLNSAQAMEESGGVVKVRLRQVDIKQDSGRRESDLKSGPYYELIVSDNGVGMPQHIQDRVFEPFFTTKGPGKGTGLGMAVVHGIVTGHGGAISISSDRNVGTTITVLIPCEEIEIGSGKDQDPPVVERQANGKEHILFVDDEVAICQSMVRPMSRLGFQISTFTSSGEALEAFRASPYKFDLVITDQNMPHLNGTDLAREISLLRADIPIVICSGYHPDLDVKSLGIENVCEILTKPIAPRRLGEVIRKLMG